MGAGRLGGRRGTALVGALVLALAAAVAVVVVRGPGLPGAQRGAAAPVRTVPPPAEPRLPGRLVDTRGVASFNAYRHLPRRAAFRDALRLTGDPRVDVVGWQETRADHVPALRRRLARVGWDTWQLWEPDGPFWLAVSWRRDRFSLVDGAWTRVHGGAGRARTDLPFPPRGYVVVRLRHRESGRILSVLDTHLNQGIETGDGFTDTVNARYARVHLRALAQAWEEVPGDLVVGTGDDNFDHRDDARARPRGGIVRTQAGHATSSYDALGRDGVVPTYGSRWIDYVWVADRTVRQRPRDPGTGQLVRHRSLGGYASDHRPLLARIRWYDRR